MIAEYQRRFIEFLITNQALRFGSFTLKSGRVSPYFINTGHFNTGASLAGLASFYASTIISNKLDGASIIFGPAYKGIPLCVAIACHLAQSQGNDIGYLFDRKEAKVHGEFSAEGHARNFLLGKIPTPDDTIIIVDDVITTGGTKYEAVELLRSVSDTVSIKGLVISVDRLEKDKDGNDPVVMFQDKTGIPVYSIISIETIMEYLESNELQRDHREAIRVYRQQWGVKR